MRLLICAGGTGGGAYPALAVLQAMVDKKLIVLDARGESDSLLFSHDINSEGSVLWIGGLGGMEAELVTRENIPYSAISAAGVHGVGIRELPGNMLRLSKGYLQARQVLNEFQPDVLFFTGGYIGVPVALAGHWVPSLLFVPDIEPGLASRSISRFVDKIDVSVQDTCSYFSKRHALSVTGYPTRHGLTSWDKESALEYFGFSGELPTLLVLGGSKGARSINEAIISVIPQLVRDMQVLHLCGKDNFPEVSDKLNGVSDSTLFIERYRVYPYLHDEMGAALRIADLVLSRAGASILGEYPLFDLPAVLVPYPHAWRYQQKNAEYLEQKGAALIIQDGELFMRMVPEVLELIRDKSRLGRMAEAMRSLSFNNAAELIAEDIVELASKKKERI